MPDFIEHLHQLVQEEADQIRERNAEQERRKAETEKFKVDTDHALELKKRHLSAERAHTLNIAWAAAELLTMEKARPEYWFRTESAYDGTSAIRRRLNRRTRQLITAEGWPLALWRDGNVYNGRVHTLILAVHPDESGSSLAVIAQETVNGYGPSNVYEALPDDIRYLHRQPLAPSDPSLPDEWPGQYPSRVRYFEDYEETKDQWSNMRLLESYRKSQIEQNIQRAIAKVVALHTVVKS